MVGALGASRLLWSCSPARSLLLPRGRESRASGVLSACPDTSAVRAGVDPCLHGNPKFPGSETKVSSSSALSVFPEMTRLGPDRSHTEKQKKLTNCAKIT